VHLKDGCEPSRKRELGESVGVTFHPSSSHTIAQRMQHSTRQRRSETGVMFPSSVSSSSTSPSTSKNRLTAILNSFRNQMPKVADFQRLSEDEKMIAYRRSMLMLDYIDQKSRQARVAAVVRSVTTRTSNAPLMERIRTNSGSNTVQQERL